MKGVHRMKKSLLFLITLILLVSLCGCANVKDPGVEIYRNEQFAVKEHNGEQYLDFHNDSYRIAADATSQNELISGHSISFSSVKEMKDCIELGKFTEEDLIAMQKYVKASNGKVAICNTKNLYDLKMPENTSLTKINWYGATYTFIAEKGPVKIKVQLVSKEHWDKYIASWDVENNSNLEIVSKEVDPNGATTIVYDNLSFNYRSKIVRYTATINGNTITYMENYDYERSETLPWGMTFWGESNGAYFYGTVSDFDETPSREWLTSFTVVPYVETVTE